MLAVTNNPEELPYTTSMYTKCGTALSISPPASAEEVDDRQQNDGSDQGDQHGRQCDCLVDRPNMEDGAEEVAAQECAQHGHHDIDHKVRAVVHQFGSYPSDHCCGK